MVSDISITANPSAIAKGIIGQLIESNFSLLLSKGISSLTGLSVSLFTSWYFNINVVIPFELNHLATSAPSLFMGKV